MRVWRSFLLPVREAESQPPFAAFSQDFSAPRGVQAQLPNRRIFAAFLKFQRLHRFTSTHYRRRLRAYCILYTRLKILNYLKILNVYSILHTVYTNVCSCSSDFNSADK